MYTLSCEKVGVAARWGGEGRGCNHMEAWQRFTDLF